MKIKADTFLILVLTLLGASCQFGSIDPSNYIWINYTASVPVVKATDQRYASRIPCESRIGKCSYKFNLLPPGWTASPDGGLQIPVQDAIRDGAFAVKAELSQPTGQRINANLVVQIKKGFLSVTDSPTFFQDVGFQPQNNQNNIFNRESKYDQSPLTTSRPLGFPTVQQLNRQTISQLNILLPRLVDKFAPCRSKINYLNSVRKMLQTRQQQNRRQRSDVQALLNQYNQRIKTLKLQREQNIKNSGRNQKIAALNNNLSALYNQYLILGNQKNIYEKLTQISFKKLQQFSPVFQNDKTAQTYKQVLNQNAEMKSMLLSRATVQKLILRKLFDESLKSLNQQNQFRGIQIQKKFNDAVDQIADSKTNQILSRIKLVELDQNRTTDLLMTGVLSQELKTLTNRLSIYGIDPTNIPEKIQISQITKTRVKQTINNKLKSVSEQNERLNKTIEEVQAIARKFNQDCAI